MLVSLAESDLMRGMQEWTRFGRADSAGEGDENSSSDSGWFRSWLRRQGHLWTITENHRWIVETDIANFFPSIQLPFLVAHVQALSRLDEGAVRLLCRIIEDVSILPEFRKSVTVGLPQENFDCSRILAHTHLRTVDDAFLEEGSRNRYSRFMDDIVIGANSKEEATRFVARIQRAMERIGLYPNTAKTRIVRASIFRKELMKSENDRIGELEEEFKANPGDPDIIAETSFEIDQHLRMRPRPRAWERVLRRWYTLCRTQMNPVLLPHALRHLLEFPGSATHILEYLTVFPMDANRLGNLFRRIDTFGGVYEDIEVLAHECVCQAPGSDTVRFRDVAAATALARIRAERSPWIAAAACVTLGKYGRPDDFRELYRMSRAGHDQAPWKLQALMVLLGSGTIQPGQAIREWRDRFPQAREIAFLEAVLAKEPRAVNMLAGFMSPREALTPHRWVVRARSMFMMPVLAYVDNDLWSARSNAWQLKMRTNPPELADRALNRWWHQRIL
ncbi:MAG: RNA-directed DNA polymerase [Candidatus Dormibacteria bacterium]